MTIEQEAFALIWLVMFFEQYSGDNRIFRETDSGNFTYIHDGTSWKVMWWFLALQNFTFALVYVHEKQQHVADALSRTPMASREANLQAVLLSDFSSVSAELLLSLFLMRVVEKTIKRRSVRCSLAITIAFRVMIGMQRTINVIISVGYDWPHMTRDVTQWV